MLILVITDCFFNVYLVCPSSWPTDYINTNDCGTQFTYSVWSSFMVKLGVSVNLVSDYHPKSNGQINKIWAFLQTFGSKNQTD